MATHELEVMALPLGARLGLGGWSQCAPDGSFWITRHVRTTPGEPLAVVFSGIDISSQGVWLELLTTPQSLAKRDQGIPGLLHGLGGAINANPSPPRHGRHPEPLAEEVQVPVPRPHQRPDLLNAIEIDVQSHEDSFRPNRQAPG